MTQKIFYIGLSRTGTLSLNHILTELGLKSLHFVDALIYDENWSVIDKYDALGDSPIPLLYKECDNRYPGSKFILTTRDKNSWLSSMRWMYIHGRIIWKWPKRLNNYHKRIYLTESFKEKILSKVFDKYHQEVRTYFQNRPNDFLEINIDNGFNIETICSFLDIPAKDFQTRVLNERRKASVFQFIGYYLRYWIVWPIKNCFKSTN